MAVLLMAVRYLLDTNTASYIIKGKSGLPARETLENRKLVQTLRIVPARRRALVPRLAFRLAAYLYLTLAERGQGHVL